MALFHLNCSIVSRSKGHSAVAQSCYINAVRMMDSRTGIVHDYRRKRHVAMSMIVTPENAPAWVQDREKLWNGIESACKRLDSQVAYSIEFALPRELTLAEWSRMVREFVQPFVARGQVADIAIHTPSGNPHAHIKLTLNALENQGFGKKVREWNPSFGGVNKKTVSDTSSLVEMRHRWAEISNAALKAAGFAESANLSAASYADRGIDIEPTVHLGKAFHLAGKTDYPLDRLAQADAIAAQREIAKIAKEEQRIHLLIKSWESELIEAKAAMTGTTTPLHADDGNAGEATHREFAATPPPRKANRAPRWFQPTAPFPNQHRNPINHLA